MTKAEQNLIEMLRYNWRNRHRCVEDKQSLPWRVWELRQLRRQKVVYLATHRFLSGSKSA